MPDFPKVATPAEVWAYGTRILTNLDDVRAARVDNLDVLLSTRLPTTDFDTRLPDARATKIDNLNAVITSRLALADFDTKLPDARAARLDKIPAAVAEVEGTASFLALDTYPKTVDVLSQELGVLFFAEGIIDLSENVAGETVNVVEGLSVVTPVAYKDYASESYTGVQTLPALYVVTKPAKYGLRIQMTMEIAPAADRAYPYQFFVRRIA